MSDVQALLTRCRELGAEFIPQPNGKLKVKAPAPLPENLRQELRRRKPEVLRWVEAMHWLRSKLTTPQRIAFLVAEWLGPEHQPTGQSLDVLMGARWALGVDTYVSDDDHLWWRLSQGTDSEEIRQWQSTPKLSVS